MRQIMLTSTLMMVLVGLVVNGCASVQSSSTTTIATTTTTTTTTTSITSTTVYNYPTAKLTHFGFDFARGVTTNDATSDCGNICTWAPLTYRSMADPYPQWDGYVWWNNRLTDQIWWDSGINYSKDMGVVSLASVVNVPAWPTTLEAYSPLFTGHVFVTRCTPEGYAKFLVTEAGTVDSQGQGDWHANVQYYYTTEAVFDK